MRTEGNTMSEIDGNGQSDDQKEMPQEFVALSTQEDTIPLGNPTKKTRASRLPPERLPFPTKTLEETIKVSSILKEFNGGKPYPVKDTAIALGIRVRGNELYRLLAASRDYGMTSGTTNAKQIVLEDIGRNIVYAKSKDDEIKAIWIAFFNVKLFKSIYDYYDGQHLREPKYLRNTLETEFNILQKYHQEFYDVYTKNIQFLESQGSTPGGKKEESKTKPPTGERQVPTPDSTVKQSLMAFVAMPLIEKSDKYPMGFFQEVLTNLISPAAEAAGFKVETARKEGSDVIQSTIVNNLLEADLVIVDLTEHNPNVLFELGMRMAIEKPIILIRAKGTIQIFDVDNLLRVLDYDSRLWKSTLESDVIKLTSHIKGGWDNKDTSQSYMTLLKKHKDN